jgi:hypothetical protein
MKSEEDESEGDEVMLRRERILKSAKDQERNNAAEGWKDACVPGCFLQRLSGISKMVATMGNSLLRMRVLSSNVGRIDVKTSVDRPGLVVASVKVGLGECSITNINS